MCIGWFYGFVFFFIFRGILKVIKDKCMLLSVKFNYFIKWIGGRGFFLWSIVVKGKVCVSGLILSLLENDLDLICKYK